jgi:hypothetical protein
MPRAAMANHANFAALRHQRWITDESRGGAELSLPPCQRPGRSWPKRSWQCGLNEAHGAAMTLVALPVWMRPN